jgi:hypothetical protein
MSVCRSQALINASPEKLWDLIGDPRRHPEWWPRVIEVNGERFDEGDNYAQVTRGAMGSLETTMSIEELADLREIHMRCLDTGTYARWLLTEAQGDTFVDVEFGMDPVGLRARIFDGVFGTMYFRRWLDESLSALEQVAEEGRGKGAPADSPSGR